MPIGDGGFRRERERERGRERERRGERERESDRKAVYDRFDSSDIASWNLACL